MVSRRRHGILRSVVELGFQLTDLALVGFGAHVFLEILGQQIWVAAMPGGD